MRRADLDMRNSSFRGDIDLRGGHRGQDVDFRNMDYDMRRLNTQMADEDYRMPYNRDQDFR